MHLIHRSIKLVILSGCLISFDFMVHLLLLFKLIFLCFFNIISNFPFLLFDHLRFKLFFRIGFFICLSQYSFLLESFCFKHVSLLHLSLLFVILTLTHHHLMLHLLIQHNFDEFLLLQLFIQNLLSFFLIFQNLVDFGLHVLCLESLYLHDEVGFHGLGLVFFMGSRASLPEDVGVISFESWFGHNRNEDKLCPEFHGTCFLELLIIQLECMLVSILVQDKALPEICFCCTKPVIRQDIFIICIKLKFFTIKDSFINVIKTEYIFEFGMFTCVILHFSLNPLLSIFKLKVRILLTKKVCIF